MPAATLSNGHTGPLGRPKADDVVEYARWIRLGAGCAAPLEPIRSVVDSTIGRRLHVCEFWMPGGCNLKCSHCYVASWDPKSNPLRASEFASLTERLVSEGLIDVIIPGMEPLLREETWAVTQAARDAGARTIGLTTNGTLLKKRLHTVLDSGLTVMNVSLDGPEHIHDSIRGAGVSRVVLDGIQALRCKSDMKILSNTTITRVNARHVVETAKIATDLGLDFAAFHPFETSEQIDNRQAVSASAVADAFDDLREAFFRGELGSIVLEAEASTFDVILALTARGWFADMDLGTPSK